MTVNRRPACEAEISENIVSSVYKQSIVRNQQRVGYIMRELSRMSCIKR